MAPQGEGCCGALVHHMGREEQALRSRDRNVDVWTSEIEKGGLDAIIVTASGCGTTIKDYGFPPAQRSGLRPEGREGFRAREGR